MWGAIIGDLAGSIYEYQQSKQASRITTQELIFKDSFFSDDSILTIAILESILKSEDYEKNLKKYAKLYENKIPHHIEYFKGMFSPNFMKWANSNIEGTSIGNGAMMRISPVGYLFDNEPDIIKNSYLATKPSHNSEEAINYATTVALIIYYFRKGYSKEEVQEKMHLQIKYVPFTKFNITCHETLSNCLYALFNSHNFKESILNVISYGGDTDTNACIVGSMAEILYGIDNETIAEAKKHIPAEFIEILNQGYSRVKKLSK